MNRIKITLNLISVAVLQKVPIISLNVQLLHLPLVGFKAHTHIVDICASPSFSLIVVIIIIFAVVVVIGNLLKPVGRRPSWILCQHQHHTPRSRLRCQIPPRWTHRHHWCYVRCDVLLHHHLLILLPLPTMQQQNQHIHCK